MSFSFLFLKCVSGGADFSEFCSCVYGVVFHPKENILASCSADKSIKLWNLDTGTELSTMNAHSDWVRAVSWSTCGKWLVSGGDDKKINIYDAQTFQVKRSLNGHSR